MRTVLPVASVLLCTAAVHAQQELHVQCPAGTGAVIRGSVVTCEPLPKGPPAPVPVAPRPPPRPEPPAPAPQVETVVIQKPPVVETAPAGHVAGMEIKGLYGVPDLCGLFIDDKPREDTAEAIYLAVSACMERVDANPPSRPGRWYPFKVEAVSTTAHVITLPQEDWARDLQACLVARPPRIPKAARGKSFTAWYMVAASPADAPTQHPCPGQNSPH